MFGRTLKASLANDNGRSTEFQKKLVYNTGSDDVRKSFDLFKFSV